MITYKDRDEAIIITHLINSLHTPLRVKPYKFTINSSGVKVLMFHLVAKKMQKDINRIYKTAFTVRDITFTIRKFAYKNMAISTFLGGKTAQGYHIRDSVLNTILESVYTETLKVGEDNIVIAEFKIRDDHDFRN